MTVPSSFHFPRKFILCGTVSTALLAAHCYGFAEVARGALTLSTAATGTYDSYFIGSADRGDDYYFTLSPQLHYLRNAGLGEIDGTLGVSANRYDKNSRFNSDDLTASLRTSFPVEAGARLSGGLNASYTEGWIVDPVVNDRVSSKVFSSSINGTYQLGLKMSLSDAFNYSNAIRKSYSDQKALSNSFAYTYSDFLDGTNLSLTHLYTADKSSGDNYLNVPLSQHSNSVSAGLTRPIIGKLNGQVSYGYSVITRAGQDTAWNNSGRMEGTTYSIGLNGPFLPPSRFPKLDSSIGIAYARSLSPGINDAGGKTLTGNFNLSWNARERTKVFIRGSRSTDLSINDLTVESTSVSTGVNEDVGYATHLDATLAYSWRKFRGVSRRDNTLSGILSAQHTFNRYLSAGANYQYEDNQLEALGSQPGRFGAGSYHRHVVSISLTDTF